MTDHELLELAARAAGIKIHSFQDGKINGTTDGLKNFHWNPLTDDGDALRLAIHLGISLETDAPIQVAFDELSGEYETGAEAWIVFPDAKTISACKLYGLDKCAAARRAIVQVAAEIGKRL